MTTTPTTPYLEKQIDEILLGLYNSACKPEDIKHGYPPMHMHEAKAKIEDYTTKKAEEARIEAQMSLIAKTEQVDDSKLRDYLRSKDYDLNQNLIELKGQQW